MFVSMYVDVVVYDNNIVNCNKTKDLRVVSILCC